MSRGIESGTTTHSPLEFLRQTTGKVGATIRTNDSWNGESCETLQQSFADSFRIQRSKRIRHRPTRKFVHQNQNIIVLGFRFITTIGPIQSIFKWLKQSSSALGIGVIGTRSATLTGVKLTNLTRCTILANSLIHSRK